MAIKVLAFDFDGVLAHSTSVKDQAIEKLLQPLGEQAQKKGLAVWHNTHGLFRPQRIAKIFQHALGRPLFPDEIERHTNHFANLVQQKTIEAPWLDGIEHFFCHTKNKRPAYVVSAAPQEEVRYIVEQRHATAWFVEVFGGPTKKAVRLSEIIKKEQIDQSELLFFGDSLSDYTAAQKVSIPFYGIVTNGPSPFPETVPILKDFSTINTILDH
ncbi:HAD family hydrolase [Magnetococcales bacterium HHB-1]